MPDALRLFVGPKAALRPFMGIVPAARAFALAPDAKLYVLPLTEVVHDGLHSAYGTGEWLTHADENRAARLTSTDAAFAARASVRSAIAFIEIDDAGGAGSQTAATWIDGGVAQKLTMLEAGGTRPQSLWPANAALRLLGAVTAGGDEFEAFGLARYRSNEDILARAFPIML